MGYVDSAYRDEDPDDLLADALTRIAEQFPGWTPRETHLEYAVLAEFTRANVDTRLLAADMQDEAFATVGIKLHGIPRMTGASAAGTVVFTLTSTAPQTVPAGTQVLWPSPSGPVPFATVVDVANTAGATTTPGVQVLAVEPGAGVNGLAAGPLDLADALPFVASVSATTTTAGGQDEEPVEDYLDRLSDSLRLLRRIPVEAADFAVLARDVAGVHRALALDNYNPADGTSNNERMVAVAAVDEAGTAVAPTVLTSLAAFLNDHREVNFVVKTMQPSYTTVNVAFAGLVELGADPVAVRAGAEQAARDYLSPALWAGGDERPPVWRKRAAVGYLEVANVIGATPGLRRLTSLTLNGGTADVPLTGAAPLPSALSTVTGTVTA